MVHQHFRLVPPFTVAENVILGEHRDEARRFFLQPRTIERAVAELGERYGLAIEPARPDLAALGRRAAAGRDPEGALPRGADPDPRRADRRAHAAGGGRALRDAAGDGRRGQDGDLHLAQAARGEGGRRPGHRAARRPRRSRPWRRPSATPRELAALMVGRDVELANRVERAAPPRRRRRRSTSRGSRCAATAARRRCGTSRSCVRDGEIVGVAGVAGNGQRELAEAITGMRPPSHGAVSRRRARSCTPATRARRSRAGVAHVPEDRLGTGVAPSLSIAENTVLKSYRGRAVSCGPILRWRGDPRARARSDQALRRPGPGVVTRARDLSGRQPAEARPRPRVRRQAEAC